MKKEDAITRWRNTPENLPILPHFTPIAADAKGSTFGACGIRICGNPEFVDAVLSRIKDLLAAECGSTRLNFSRATVKPVTVNDNTKQWANADTDAETCYIQIRERTAKTRLRKVREMSAPLPNLTASPASTPSLFPVDDGEGGNKPSKPSPSSKPSPAPVAAPANDDGEPLKVAHIGNRNGGEVLWDDNETESEPETF